MISYGDIFQIIMFCFMVLFFCIWLIKIIFEKIFIKLNYKFLLENGSVCEYEDVKKMFRIINYNFYFMPGDFKLMYMNENLIILKIKTAYYQFDGSSLNFMFCEKCFVLDELEKRILALKSKEK